MALLTAVIEKRAGYFLGGLDAYVNVVGGFRIDETAVDLAVIMALASSLKDQPIPEDILVFGEAGLSGEIRSVSHMELRIKEAQRLGFRACVIPKYALKKMKDMNFSIELIGVSNVRDAIKLLSQWN